MNLRSVIEELGYSPHEAAVYLSALELGSGTETEIAGKAKLPRTTVESIIATLHRKGLMNAYLKGRRRMWTAENPEKLLAMMREREMMLSTHMYEFRSLRKEPGTPPMIRSFSGVEEIKRVMADMINTKHHIFAVLLWDDWTALLGKTNIDAFMELRKQRNLKLFLLTPQTKISAALREHDNVDVRITQFLPDIIAVSNANFIYENKVAIISTNPKMPMGILIDDRDIHHTMEIFFESLWLRSGGTLAELS